MMTGKNKKIDITAETGIVDTDNQDKKDDSDNVDEETKAGDPIKELEVKLEAANQEISQNYDLFLRASAELENYKKRSAREMDEFRKYANESLLKEILPALDNLERAIDSSSKDKSTNNSVVEGVDMTLKEIFRVFEKFAVKPIESLGKPFDPAFHQAMMQEKAEDVEENIVLKELQKGYTIHGRLLRPAMVVVSKSEVNTGDEEKQHNKERE